jgi:hypothetical protein
VTDQPKTFPSIHGRCPACRGDSLFIGTGGWVTCSRLDCPNPSAADELLHGDHVTAATPLVCSDERHTAKVADLEQQLARLHEGEEPGADPVFEPTPGQWIHQFNQATAAKRLEVVGQLLDTAWRAWACTMNLHEERIHDGRHAEMALNEVRHVVADMEATTGARTWAGWLRDAMKRGPEVCLLCATEQKTEPDADPFSYEERERTGRNAGLLTGDETAALRVDLPGPAATQATEPIDTAHRYCILCGTRFQPGHTCDPAGLRKVYGSLVDRAERKHERAEQLAATLREVLDTFTTARRDDGVIAGYFLEGAIHPDDFDRWRARLPERVCTCGEPTGDDEHDTEVRAGWLHSRSCAAVKEQP